jgi:hypothetical protein
MKCTLEKKKKHSHSILHHYDYIHVAFAQHFVQTHLISLENQMAGIGTKVLHGPKHSHFNFLCLTDTEKKIKKVRTKSGRVRPNAPECALTTLFVFAKYYYDLNNSNVLF